MSGDGASSLAEALLGALERQDPTVRSTMVEHAANALHPEEVISALADGSNAGRRNAAIDVLSRSGARSVPALLKALHDQDPEVVMFAAGILGKTHDAAAIPHLVGLLDHEDINVAQAAIDSLSQLRSSLAIGSLVSLLDRDPWLRFAAVHALGEIGDPGAVSALTPLLGDETVRGAVIEALGKIGSEEALSQLAGLLREQVHSDVFGECLRAIGNVLEKHPRDEVLQSVTSWTQLASGAALEVHVRLVEVLTGDGLFVGSPSDECDAKAAAASIVRALKLRPLYTALILAGRDPALREMLQFCVVSLGADLAPALKMGLGHPNTNVRIISAECTGALNLAELGPLVERLLDHPDEAVRTTAIRTLMRLHDVVAIPSIAKHLGDEAARVREAATLALSLMDAEAVTNALLWEKEQSATFRRAALQITCANSHPRQRGFIETCLGDPDEDIRLSAVRALGAQPAYDLLRPLSPLLRDPCVAVRRAVVTVLGRSKDQRVRDLLLQQIERDAETRRDAVRELAGFGDASAAAFLIQVYEKEQAPARLEIIDALAELRDPAAEPMLVRLLADGSIEVRCAAVAALTRFGTRAAMRHIVGAARDPSPEVRATVARVPGIGRFDAGYAALERLCQDEDGEVAQIARRAIEQRGDPHA